MRRHAEGHAPGLDRLVDRLHRPQGDHFHGTAWGEDEAQKPTIPSHFGSRFLVGWRVVPILDEVDQYGILRQGGLDFLQRDLAFGLAVVRAAGRELGLQEFFFGGEFRRSLPPVRLLLGVGRGPGQTGQLRRHALQSGERLQQFRAFGSSPGQPVPPQDDPFPGEQLTVHCCRKPPAASG